MASASFQIANNSDSIDNLSAGAQNITEGVAAPTTANNLEIRIDLAGGWTKEQLRVAFKTIWRYLSNSNNSTSVPL